MEKIINEIIIKPMSLSANTEEEIIIIPKLIDSHQGQASSADKKLPTALAALPF